MKAKLADEVFLLFFGKHLSDKGLQLPFFKRFRLREGINLNQQIRGGLPKFFAINATWILVNRFPKFRSFGFSLIIFKISQALGDNRFNILNLIFKGIVAFVALKYGKVNIFRKSMQQAVSLGQGCSTLEHNVIDVDRFRQIFQRLGDPIIFFNVHLRQAKSFSG